MPRRKTKILAYEYLQWRFDSLQKRLCRILQGFPQATKPENPQYVFQLLYLSKVAPELFSAKTREANTLRREMVDVMVRHPEFMGALILCLHGQTRGSATERVREFLLTEPTVVIADGRRVDTIGASDKEIAEAVAVKFSLNHVSVAMVRRERERLEQDWGVPVSKFVKATMKVCNDRRYSLRKFFIKSHYTPQP